MRRRFPAAAALAAAAMLLSACTGKPPEISRVAFQLLLAQNPDSGAVAERLSLFTVASDPDGFDDLAALYLIHDGSELFWKLEPSGWIKTVHEGETWIGGNGIGMADGSPMPRGEYRALLQDKGGDSVENVFSLSAPDLEAARVAFPKAAAAGGSISFTGLKESSELWICDAADRFVSGIPVEKDPVTVASIVQQNPGLAQQFRYRLYTWDREKGVGLVTGPYVQGALKTP